MRSLFRVYSVAARLLFPACVFAIDPSAIPDLTCVPLNMNGGPTPGRAEFTTAYDYINNVWINGFGCTSPCYSSDTYEYDLISDTWSTTFPLYCRGSSPSDRPGGRCTFGISFSSRDTVVLLHAGANAGPDTWLYSPKRNSWTQKAGWPGLIAEGQGVVYDSVSNFFYTKEAYSDGLAYPLYQYSVSANQWTNTNSQNSPATGYCYTMAVSENRRIILLVTTAGEDWVYHIDQNRWAQLNSNAPAHGPRYRAGLVYDIANDVFFLMGHKDAAAPSLFKLEMDPSNTSGTWTNITSQVNNMPEIERGSTLVYDRTHNVCLMNERITGPTTLRYAFRYKNPAGTKIASSPRLAPPAADIFSCFPNPFHVNSHFHIRPDAGNQSRSASAVRIYSPNGALLENLGFEKSAGAYFAEWNAGNYPSGVYIGTVTIGDKTYSAKVLKR